MRRRLSVLGVVVAAAAATTPAGAADSRPEATRCQVGDPALGAPGHDAPTYVPRSQVVETPDAVVLRCTGPLSAGGAPIDNPAGTVVFSGFPCLLAVGWLQQGHPPGPLPLTYDSRQRTSAGGRTVLTCTFSKPFTTWWPSAPA